MLSDIIQGAGAILGTAAAFDQNKLNKEALKQQQKNIKTARKYADKAIKTAEDYPEYDPITGEKIDQTLEQNIQQSQEGLRKLQALTTEENVFNIEEARRTNEYIQQELERFLPGYQQLQNSMSQVIASNLAGDMTPAEKAALLEDVRASAASRGVTGGVEDTANMLAFFDRRRSLMNAGVSQNLQATQLAKSISYEPPTALRRDFAPIGTLTGAQRLGTEQTERLNAYNSRVQALQARLSALQMAANVSIGAASSIQPQQSPLAALSPLLSGIANIVERRETRQIEQRNYETQREYNDRVLKILERRGL